MNILVTGGSGKIGAAAIRELLGHGHQIIATDVRAGEAPWETRLVDLQRFDDVRKLMEGVEAVVQMGNLPGFSRVGDAEGFANNVVSTHNVFQAAFDAGVRRIVNASSIQSYGFIGPPQTTAAPLYLPVDEDHPLRPQAGYPLSKAMTEHIAESFARRVPSLSVFSLRFTAVRRIESDSSRVSTTRTKTKAWWNWSMGGSLGTYIRVEDAARLIRLCIESGRPGHTPLNAVAVRPLRPWSVEDIVECYGEMPPFKRPLVPDDPLLSGERARELLGFVAELPPSVTAPVPTPV